MTGRFAMSISRRKPGLAIQRLGSRLHKFQEGLESPVDYNPWMASAEHGSHQPVRSTDPQPDGTLAKDLASEDILEILRLPDGTIKYQHSIGSPIVRRATSCNLLGPQ